MDVYQTTQWWPFHPFKTTVDQLRKNFVAILDTRNPEKRTLLLQAYLHDHAELLKTAPIDIESVSDYLSHSLPDMLLK